MREQMLEVPPEFWCDTRCYPLRYGQVVEVLTSAGTPLYKTDLPRAQSVGAWALDVILGTEIACALGFAREDCEFRVVANSDIAYWARRTMTEQERQRHQNTSAEYLGNVGGIFFGVCLMAGDLESCRAFIATLLGARAALFRAAMGVDRRTVPRHGTEERKAMESAFRRQVHHPPSPEDDLPWPECLAETPFAELVTTNLPDPWNNGSPGLAGRITPNAQRACMWHAAWPLWIAVPPGGDVWLDHGAVSHDPQTGA